MKKLLISSLLISVLTAMSMSAFAQRGGVQQRTCTSVNDRTDSIVYNSLKFDCADLGTLTVKEMNAKGWKVVQMHSITRCPSGCFYTWTLLIEK